MTPDLNDAPPAWLGMLSRVLQERFGHVLPDRRIEQLASVVSTLARDTGQSAEGYIGALRTIPLTDPVCQAFINELTIKETYFFRDRPTVDTLRKELLPALIERCSRNKELRVWSAGCSTGEELYTLSILLQELLDVPQTWNLHLVGTDLDTGALARARAATYKNWSMRALDTEERSRYFTVDASSGLYSLREHYKRQVTFHTHNLLDGSGALPSPGRFDLILCRNVTIYLGAEGQRAVSSLFETALAPHGLWVSGSSDPVPGAGFRTRIYPGVLVHSKPDNSSLRDEPAMPVAAARALAAPASPAPSRTSDPVSLALPPSEVLPRPVSRREPLTAPSRRSTTDTPAQSAVAPTAPSDGSVPSATVELAAATACADQGAFEEALTRAAHLMAAHPLWARPHLLAAQVTQSLGQHEEAVAHLRRALYLEPDSAETHLRLGLLLVRKGEREQAIKALRSAMLFARLLPADVAAQLRTTATKRLVQLMRELAQ
jgi:chemotaxis protein methyltransferase CheR